MNTINKKSNLLKRILIIALTFNLCGLPAFKAAADITYETPSESLPNFDLLTEQQRMEGFERLELEQSLASMPLPTNRLQQAADYFKAKEDDKARTALDINAITQEQNELLSKLAKQPELQARLDEKALELILLAQLTVLDYKLGEQRISKANGYFEQALKSGRTQERLYVYARFTEKNDQLEQAEQLYTEALIQQRKKAIDQTKELALLIDLLNMLGTVKEKRGQLAEAFALQTEAITLNRQLIVDEPESILQLSVILSSLSQLAMMDNKRNSELIKLYVETANILRPLATSSPDTYLATLAGLLNSLGITMASMQPTDKQTQEIEQHYTEALNGYRKLAETDSNTHLPNVAMVLNNLAGLLLEKDSNTRRPEIEKLLTESLNINRQLSNAHPDPYLRIVYQADVIRTLEMLGRAHLTWKEPTQAQTYLQEALQLAEAKPAEYKYQLSSIKQVLNTLK